MTRRLAILALLLIPMISAAGQEAKPTVGLPLKTARTDSFTTTTGTWISLDVSPNGQQIVFDLLGDLYTMPITGGKATPLTHGMAYDAQPRFSPDGKRIVFVSDRSGGENLWLMNADGTDTTALTTGNDNKYISPEWTPDGQYIVTSRSGGTFGTAKLYLYHVDGGKGVQLSSTPAPAANLKMLGAAFGKDPRYTWYAARTGDWQYNSVGPQYQLQVWDRETGRTSQMTSRTGSAFRPALSPDGKYLVYASRFETKTGLRLRDLATQQEDWLAFPVQRDDIESRAPMDAYPGYAFLPDSKAIIVSYGGEIWRVPIDKSAASKIPFEAAVHLELGPEVKFAYHVDTASTFTASQVRDIAASPDGTHLAFSALDRLYVADMTAGVPTGTPVRVTSATVGEFGPVWSPDSKSLAYVTWSDATGGQLLRATRDGRGRWNSQVLADHGLFTDLAWSPTGDRVVAVRSATREMQEAGGAFFGPVAAEFVWVPAGGGTVTSIMPTAGMGIPQFTRNADRIYAYGSAGLVSFRWDGTDLKTHLKVTGPMPPGAGGSPLTLDAGLDAEAATHWIGGRGMRPVAAATPLGDPAEPTPPQAPPASLVLVGPDGDVALAMVGMDFYTIAIPTIGAAAPTVSVADPGSASVPVTKLNEIGGEFPTWTAGGRQVMWALGNAVWTYDIARSKAVADSLKATAKAKALLLLDPTKKDSITRADSITKADTL
ncbi:MAG: amidohydrolase, partial [Gemmatimonadota bacterium]